MSLSGPTVWQHVPFADNTPPQAVLGRLPSSATAVPQEHRRWSTKGICVVDRLPSTVRLAQVPESYRGMFNDSADSRGLDFKKIRGGQTIWRAVLFVNDATPPYGETQG